MNEPQPLPQELVQRDTDELLYQLTRAGGNVKLASERLGIAPETLVAQLATNPESQELLYRQFRIAATINLFDVLNQVQLVLLASLPNLAPYEVAKTFTSLVQMLSQLTESNSNATVIDPVQTAMRSLPPGVRKALSEILDNEG